MSRPPRIPNWLSWEQRTIYFITLCVQDRKSVLANLKAWRICRDTCAKLNRWIVLAAIAMPDHLHLLAAPIGNRDASLSDFTKWFKRWFNEEYRNCRPSVSDGRAKAWHWQEGCFDRLLRSGESLSEKWEYLRQNPVRAGLVENADDWPYQFQFNADL
jgi:REP element-mobilizing transposase RayT